MVRMLTFRGEYGHFWIRSSEHLQAPSCPRSPLPISIVRTTCFLRVQRISRGIFCLTTNYANRPNFSESPFIRIRVIRVIRVQNIFSRVQQIWIKFAWLRNSSLRHSRDCAAQGKPPSQLLFFVGVRHRIYKSTLKSLLFSHDKDAVFPCFVYFCFTKKGCGMAEDWKRSPSYLCTR